MPTDSNPFDEIRRLATEREEALRRYAQHLASIQIRNSRWSVLLSHGRAAARGRCQAPAELALNAIPHAH
jgi:hypothetical protein